MRRRMSARSLAVAAGLTADTISRIQNGTRTPDMRTVEKLAAALAYPKAFFFEADPKDIDEKGVSFRSFSKMSAGERGAALSAGSLGVELVNWVDKRFDLPIVDLPDLSYNASMEQAAVDLRQYWCIGERPIAHVIGLLENKGVRVLALNENTANVNAFSFWRDGQPFVFLNNYKTAESSVFDAAHELGHLVVHNKGATAGSRLLEKEADQFAAAFLMPENDIRAAVKGQVSSDFLISNKFRWKVSAFALLVRLWNLGLIASEHQYRSLCIDLSRRGYRMSEPGGIARETSMIWQQVLQMLWQDKFTKEDIAKSLQIPLDELEGLIANMLPNKKQPAYRTINSV